MGQRRSGELSLYSTALPRHTRAEPHHSEALSRNVAIWIWLTRIFAAAIPNLTTRSVGPLASLNDPDKGVTPQESTALIVKNYQGLKDDLQILNKLMHIARNLLVTTEPEVPQDLCAAVHFDQMVYQTIILCVNVTSKGYDGEVLDEHSRQRLNEITELCKAIALPPSPVYLGTGNGTGNGNGNCTDRHAVQTRRYW
jgi:palmitoyltransferase